MPEGFMLPLPGGSRFCLFHPSVGSKAGAVAAVYVHPFAEEMNKSRRMAAMQSRALSEAGISVLQIDLFGCGDSAGDFGEATWSVWVDDVVEAIRWLRARTGLDPFLWGLRSGCLLAVAAGAKLETGPDFLFWQPVISGSQHLQQFLRLRMASELVGGASNRTGTNELRTQLESGMTLDIAGYALTPGVALGLHAADLAPSTVGTRVAWFEVSPSDPAELSPAGHMRVEAWRAAGNDVTAVAVSGLPFWQTQEIAECPALVDATTAVVRRWQA